MKSVALVIPAAALLALAAPARADAPADSLGPREIALGDSTRADARGATSMILNPAGLALTRELVFEGAYGYGDGTTTSHDVAVSGCDSTVPFPGCLYYRYHRSSPDQGVDALRSRVHEVGSTVARAFGTHVYAGVTARYFDYETQDEDESGFVIDAGLLVRVLDNVHIAAVGHHLVGGTEARYPRSVGTGIAVRPLPALVLSADGLWNLEAEGSTGRYGGGIEYSLSSPDHQSSYPLRLGMLRDVAVDATYVSGGLGIMTVNLALDVGARKQLGGDDLAIVASLRIFGPRLIPGTNRYR